MAQPTSASKNLRISLPNPLKNSISGSVFGKKMNQQVALKAKQSEIFFRIVLVIAVYVMQTNAFLCIRRLTKNASGVQLPPYFKGKLSVISQNISFALRFVRNAFFGSSALCFVTFAVSLAKLFILQPMRLTEFTRRSFVRIIAHFAQSGLSPPGTFRLRSLVYFNRALRTVFLSVSRRFTANRTESFGTFQNCINGIFVQTKFTSGFSA